MNLSGYNQEQSKKWIGITAVVVVHALILYALINGLGTQIISVIKELPIETTLIEEIQPPAPPAPVAPPKLVAPSKPVIPTPEVAQLSPAPDAIQAVIDTQPVQESVAAEPSKGPTVAPAVVDFSTCVKPDYPRNSLRNEEQGTVRIQFLIGLDGHVADARIEKSSGFRALDTAAKNALRLCKFKPGTINGVPQESWTTVNYVWQLPD